MSLWNSYKSLSTRTRLLIGGGVMVYAVAGLFLSDKAEESLGYTPSEEDKRRLDQAIPRIRVVDKGER